MTTLFEPDAGQYRFDEDNSTASIGERGGGRVYVWDERTVFAVQVAQTTRRPLLLRGPAGSGKSSLAPFVANTLGASFYSFTVNARSQARDMMWEFDALSRLNDANVAQSDEAARRRVGNLYNYVRPRTLWWAFDSASAMRRGAPDDVELQVDAARDPSGSGDPDRAVVLIDEIDKADPDVPNNLLEALGSRQFTVTDTGTRVVDRNTPLVMITTNEERELPSAFLRRCIVLHLKAKTAHELCDIAAQHFGEADRATYEKVAQTLDLLRREAVKSNHRPPSTAEFLDAIAAVRQLNVGDVQWPQLVEVALTKQEAAATEALLGA